MAMASWDYETEATKKRYRDSAKKLVGDPLELLKEIEAFLAGAESEPDVDLSDRVVAKLKEMVATYDNDMRSIAPPLPSPAQRKVAIAEWRRGGVTDGDVIEWTDWGSLRSATGTAAFPENEAWHYQVRLIDTDNEAIVWETQGNRGGTCFYSGADVGEVARCMPITAAHYGYDLEPES